MKTTLNKIRDCVPCSGGWTKLLKSLNKTKADDEPVSIVQVLDSNGLNDALWCLRAVSGRDREIRHYAVWCARQVEHLMTDQRSKNALNVSERFADGLATQEELNAARDAAGEAAWEATREELDAALSAPWGAARGAAWEAAQSAALSAPWGAARRAAWDAAWVAALSAAQSAAQSAALRAAWDAAWKAQEKKLRELCVWCDQNPVSAAMKEGK